MANLLCDEMNGSYIQQEQLAKHKRKMVDHYEDDEDCGKRIKFDEEYHPATKTWSCTQCGKLFSSKSNLKVHLRVHTRIRPYHCKHCTYSCMHHSSIREHLAKIHPECAHNAGSPGYVYNSSVVPDPVEFNSSSFDKQAFIAEAKQNNDKLSAQITSTIHHTPPTPTFVNQTAFSILDTPVSISPTSSTNEEPQQPVKRRRRTTTKKQKSLDSIQPLQTTTTKQNPFSIDSIMNTPPTSSYKQVQNTNSNLYQHWNAAAWLYANQMLLKMMTIHKN